MENQELQVCLEEELVQEVEVLKGVMDKLPRLPQLVGNAQQVHQAFLDIKANVDLVERRVQEERLVHLDVMGILVMRGLRVNLDCTEILENPVQKVLLVKMESDIQRVHLVQKEKREYLEWLEMKDLQEIEEMMLRLALKAKLDHQDHLVKEAKMDILGQMEMEDLQALMLNIALVLHVQMVKVQERDNMTLNKLHKARERM